jgi:hypothetical protein
VSSTRRRRRLVAVNVAATARTGRWRRRRRRRRSGGRGGGGVMTSVSECDASPDRSHSRTRRRARRAHARMHTLVSHTPVHRFRGTDTPRVDGLSSFVARPFAALARRLVSSRRSQPQWCWAVLPCRHVAAASVAVPSHAAAVGGAAVPPRHCSSAAPITRCDLPSRDAYRTWLVVTQGTRSAH